MSDLNRDKAIFDVIKQAYDYQFDAREKLDAKLNNFMSIIGTIATISIGIGFFVFDGIPLTNSFYVYLVSSFIAEITLFAAALIKALHAYAPMDLYHTTGEPSKFIEKYKDLTETHVIREVGATMAEVTEANKRVNLLKTNAIQWIFRGLILAIVVMVVFAIILVLALAFGMPVDP